MPDALLETIVPRAIRLAEAPSYGQVISEYDPESRGAAAYEQLADEILARLGWPERSPHATLDLHGALMAAADRGDGMHDGHGFSAG
jgi:chromosome partitioning protein